MTLHEQDSTHLEEPMVRIVLTALDEVMTKAWNHHCGDLDFVTVYQGSIFEVACDAVVSPANSFCYMDGGIDLHYITHFGWGVQEELQTLISSIHHGELLVGSAEIVPTENEEIPYLIAAPTMRVPMILHDSIAAYLAARAALLMVKFGVFQTGSFKGEAVSDHVNTIAFPGLGTGVGRMPADLCGRQMREAIEAVVLENRPFPDTWYEAQEQHQRMYSDEVRDLQFE